MLSLILLDIPDLIFLQGLLSCHVACGRCKCDLLCAGADITDYFNYGFTEETWQSYCEKQRRLLAMNDAGGPKTVVSLSCSTVTAFLTCCEYIVRVAA